MPNSIYQIESKKFAVIRGIVCVRALFMDFFFLSLFTNAGHWSKAHIFQWIAFVKDVCHRLYIPLFLFPTNICVREMNGKKSTIKIGNELDECVSVVAGYHMRAFVTSTTTTTTTTEEKKKKKENLS